MKAIAVATAIFSAYALAAAAQSTIRGRVVADDTGDPVVNARVSLAPAAPGTPVVLSDADGRFVLPDRPVVPPSSPAKRRTRGPN